MTTLALTHIVQTPEVLSGQPRIADTRISVAQVAVWHERLGLSADEIAGEYDLTLAQVYAALAYYHEHRATIDMIIRESTEWVAALQRARPSKLGRNS